MATLTPAYGGSGGGGFTLGPAQNVFTGADRAAAEAARDTYQAVNASWLATYNGNVDLNIRLEYTESGNAVALYQVRDSSGASWVDNSSAIGVQGERGIDGTVLEFSDETSRDTFFASRRDMLRNNLPIMVTVRDETIELQTWTGATNPPTYNANLWRPASVMSATASFLLADVHAISSGGQNVFTINESSDLIFYPPWQYVGDHRTSGGRTVSSIPDARRYTPDGSSTPSDVEPGGARALSGSVAFDVDFNILNFHTALFGLTYVPEEAYTGRITYQVTNVDTNIIVYNQAEDVTLTAGMEFSQWFQFPFEARLGENLNAQLLKEDLTVLSVRPEAGDATRPYTTSHIRSYADNPLIVSDAAAEQLETVIVGGEGINITRAGNVLTVSRSGNGGGGNPDAPGERMYFGLSNESDAASVDVTTLTRLNAHTNPQLITLGTATQGQYGWIFTENANDLSTITDTVLQQDVTDLFAETTNAQTIDTISFGARRVGPLNAGFNEQYMVRF